VRDKLLRQIGNHPQEITFMKFSSFKHVALATGLALASLVSVAATPYTSLYVFGDSLSDGGNNRAVLGNGGAGQVITNNSYIPILPYASGTYSNGPVWVNSFASALGLGPFAAPSLAGGGNYAYGGARANAGGAFPPSAAAQVSSFLTGKLSISADGLYVVAIGGNDARAAAEAIAGGAPINSTIATAAAAYAANVGQIVDDLQAKGASRIVVWDTPNLGKAPASLAAGPGASFLGTSIAQSFNAKLSERLLTEPTSVTMFDIFGVFNTIAANPAAYGLTNISDACGAVLGCEANQYLFWDGIHPTARGQVLIADAMLASVGAIPEPATVFTLIAGLGLMMLAVRRKRVPVRT
jgi:outer membrane lipase/esterase